MSNPLAIPLPNIDAAIAALVALRLDPDRGSFAYLTALRCLDAIIGNDALTSEIETAESDLGLDDSECLACGASSCGCDAQYEDRVSWGLASTGTHGSGYWL